MAARFIVAQLPTDYEQRSQFLIIDTEGGILAIASDQWVAKQIAAALEARPPEQDPEPF